MSFVYPWAWLIMVLLPLWLLFYWLKRKARPQVVSSLFLWRGITQVRPGGRDWKRQPLPPVFWLELVLLLLLATAIARPIRHGHRTQNRLVVVLDDSFSMLAQPEPGSADTVRNAASAYLASLWEEGHFAAVRFVLAGPDPRPLGESQTEWARVQALLSEWSCFAPEADLPAAITLASSFSGPLGQILVLTDQAPEQDLVHPRLYWRAFGRPRSNTAFQLAQRRLRPEGGERLLLELVCFGSKSLETVLSADPPVFAKRTMVLEPGHPSSFVFALPKETQDLTLTLGPDSLPFDNRITLAPQPARPLSMDLDLGDASVSRLIKRALQACGWKPPLAASADRLDWLAFPGEPLPGVVSGQWPVYFYQPVTGSAYLGPFIADSAHPLMTGLSFDGLIWFADPHFKAPGQPLLTAGNICLISGQEMNDGHWQLFFNLDFHRSNLAQSPTWPSLVSNLLQWRTKALPGPEFSNIPLGAPLRVRFPVGLKMAHIVAPGGSIRDLAQPSELVAFTPHKPGSHTIKWGDLEERVAVQPIAPSESDLESAVSGTWGRLQDEPQRQPGSWDLSWLPVFLLLLLGVVHHFWVAQAGALP